MANAFEKPLLKVRRLISTECTECGLCTEACRFLHKYGNPKQIADSLDRSDKTEQDMAFECSLCHLCTAVCPQGIDPAGMFLEMRREAVQHGMGAYLEHRAILRYERLGTSKRYSWYGLPAKCDTAFFPGCTLSGTRPGKVLASFAFLKTRIPNAGIVLDCCTKPSHDLGRQGFFQNMFGEMKAFLLEKGVREILLACPSCTQVFQEYAPEMTVTTIYEFMADDSFTVQSATGKTVSIHDPCALRFEEPVHRAVRQLLVKQGLGIEEMFHSGKRTICCGEGGSACFVCPELSNEWVMLRKRETNGRQIFTYCAGCVNRLKSVLPVTHVIDLIFEPEKALKGKSRVSRPPVTYFNRLWLKQRLRKTVAASVIRERDFTARLDE